MTYEEYIAYHIRGDAGVEERMIAALCRSVLEPRFLGRQAGTSPLVTLLVMYIGLRLFGIGGLILAPIALSAGMAVIEG